MELNLYFHQSIFFFTQVSLFSHFNYRMWKTLPILQWCDPVRILLSCIEWHLCWKTKTHVNTPAVALPSSHSQVWLNMFPLQPEAEQSTIWHVCPPHRWGWRWSLAILFLFYTIRCAVILTVWHEWGQSAGPVSISMSAPISELPLKEFFKFYFIGGLAF